MFGRKKKQQKVRPPISLEEAGFEPEYYDGGEETSRDIFEEVPSAISREVSREAQGSNQGGEVPERVGGDSGPRPRPVSPRRPVQAMAPEMNEGVHARRMPKYVEAWGWAASSAKFRGLLVLILSFMLCCSSVAILMMNSMLAKKNYIVVGMYPDGKPVILEQLANYNPGPELFAREFVSKFLNYSNLTIEKNMSDSMGMSTDGFKESWEHRFGKSFVSSVRRDRIVQVTTVNDVEIKNLQARQFTATLWTVRYRNSDLTQETKEEKIKYEIDIYKGTPTVNNPWGFFVSALREFMY